MLGAGLNTLSHRLCADAQFIEGWMRGTYVVAGIFAIPTDTLDVPTLKAHIPLLYEGTKEARRGWWPRGIAGTFLFPFYLAPRFSVEVTSWVQRRHPYRWAIWHEPILYDVDRHAVAMRGDYGHFGSAFYPLVGALYMRALKAISLRLGREFPAFINGKATAGRPAEPGASPNGGPAEHTENSRAIDGPPSVS